MNLHANDLLNYLLLYKECRLLIFNTLHSNRFMIMN
jgi:hypothetical protein